MGIVAYGDDTPQGDVCGQYAVEAKDEVVYSERFRQVYMRPHLFGMHARVCSARHDDRRRLAQDKRKSTLQLPLHSGCVGLALRPLVAAAAVGERDEIAHL